MNDPGPLGLFIGPMNDPGPLGLFVGPTADNPKGPGIYVTDSLGHRVLGIETTDESGQRIVLIPGTIGGHLYPKIREFEYRLKTDRNILISYQGWSGHIAKLWDIGFGAIGSPWEDSDKAQWQCWFAHTDTSTQADVRAELDAARVTLFHLGQERQRSLLALAAERERSLAVVAEQRAAAEQQIAQHQHNVMQELDNAVRIISEEQQRSLFAVEAERERSLAFLAEQRAAAEQQIAEHQQSLMRESADKTHNASAQVPESTQVSVAGAKLSTKPRGPFYAVAQIIERFPIVSSGVVACAAAFSASLFPLHGSAHEAIIVSSALLSYIGWKIAITETTTSAA